MATRQKSRPKLQNQYVGAKSKARGTGNAVKSPKNAEVLSLNEGREPGHNVPAKGFPPRPTAQGKMVPQKKSPTNTSDKKQGPQSKRG